MQSRPRIRPVVLYCAVALIAALGAGTWWLVSEVSPAAQDEASIDQGPGNETGAPVDGRLTTDMLGLSEHDLEGRDRAQFTKTIRSVERYYSFTGVATDEFVKAHSEVATWAADAEIRVYRLESRETTSTRSSSPSVVPTGSEFMVIVVSDAGLEIRFQ